MRRALSWSVRFRLRQYVKSSLWFVPLLGGIAGWILGATPFLLAADVDLPASWEYSPSTASSVLTTIVAAAAALTGFVVTVSVLVVQMASSTFSARYMRLWYRDRMLKALLAVLIATMTLSFTLLRRVESDTVPNLGVSVAGILLTSGILLFLFFLDRVLHRLRPVAVAALVSDLGRRQLLAITDVAEVAERGVGPTERAGEPSLRVRAGRSGAIQAFDTDGLVRWAERNECVVSFPGAVGDYVEAGSAVVLVHGAVADPARAEQELRGMLALGIERTIDQDPAFAIRIVVDIAIKALSPAVNDPTTAVQALNHLGDLLYLIGGIDLTGRAEVRDASGRVRLLLVTRRWEDYLALGITEIRQYGANSVQVTRRLRALLEGLLATVRPECRPAVLEELQRLDASVAATFGGSVDLDRALAADRQGIGGPAAAASPVRGDAPPHAGGHARGDLVREPRKERA
jgi:uncharacterized membrane protein